MKQMLSGLERSREVTQRDAAGAQHGAFLLQSRLDEVSREREGLAQQLEIEKGRVEQVHRPPAALALAAATAALASAALASAASPA